jgi:hypothetical protein
LLNIVFCKCFVFSAKIIDHDGRRGNAMRAPAQWWHTVASSEARDVLHRAMCPPSHRRICMAIENAVVVINFVVAITIAKDHVMVI